MRHQLYSQKEPSWRLKVAKRRYEFMDSWQGLQSQELWPGTDDFVVKRADGMFAYNLAVVMDDIAMGITDVVRGYDLLPAVASQLWLYEVLDESAPIYWHAPLVVDEDGYRLSKRQQSITLRELRESGYSAPMILGRLALAAGLVSRKALGPGETLSWSALLDSNIENLSLKQQQIKLTNFDIVI